MMAKTKRFLTAVVQGGLVALLCAAVAGCAAVAPRLQESGLNSGFPFRPETPFETYLLSTGRMIEQARVDLNDANRETVLRANAPFELRPDPVRFPRTRQGKHPKGVLLIHGLSDSPYMMQPLARHLRERGFLVRAILLPGHGTVPGDLRRVTYVDWIEAATYGLRTLKADADRVYVGGFSTGGALAVFLALEDPDVAGLLLFAPAFDTRNKLAALGGWLGLFRDWVGPQRDDADYAKYESFATNAVHQIYDLTRELAARLEARKRLDTPVFAAFSEDDRTVDSDRTVEVIDRYGASKNNRRIVYTKTPRPDQAGIGGVTVYACSSRPAERILDFSHIAVPIPPDDRHYGRNGDYKNCLHYASEPDKRRLCLAGGDSVWEGETTSANLRAVTLRRLSYNPLFPGLLKQIDLFLKDTEASD